jgi:hypothetical protein
MKLTSKIRTYLIKKIGKVSNRGCGDTWGTSCGTSAEFQAWQDKAWKSYPRLMGICSMVEIVEDEIGYFWGNYWKRPRRYLINRFVEKTHLIETGLPKGRWLDYRARMLHGIMSEIVRYIELSDKDSIQRLVLDYVRNGVEYNGDMFEGKEATKWYLDMRANLTPICEAYLWWKDIHPTYTVRVEELYESIEPSKGESKDGCFLSEGRRAIYDKIYAIEKEQMDAEVANCQKVISALPWLYD